VESTLLQITHLYVRTAQLVTNRQLLELSVRLASLDTSAPPQVQNVFSVLLARKLQTQLQCSAMIVCQATNPRILVWNVKLANLDILPALAARLNARNVLLESFRVTIIWLVFLVRWAMCGLKTHRNVLVVMLGASRMMENVLIVLLGNFPLLRIQPVVATVRLDQEHWSLAVYVQSALVASLATR
jgi:hypothetical protein